MKFIFCKLKNLKNMKLFKFDDNLEVLFESREIGRARKVGGNPSSKHERFQFMGIRS